MERIHRQPMFLENDGLYYIIYISSPKMNKWNRRNFWRSAARKQACHGTIHAVIRVDPEDENKCVLTRCHGDSAVASPADSSEKCSLLQHRHPFLLENIEMMQR